MKLDIYIPVEKQTDGYIRAYWYVCCINFNYETNKKHTL